MKRTLFTSLPRFELRNHFLTENIALLHINPIFGHDARNIGTSREPEAGQRENEETVGEAGQDAISHWCSERYIITEIGAPPFSQQREMTSMSDLAEPKRQRAQSHRATSQDS